MTFFSEPTQASGSTRYHQGHYFVSSVALPQQLQQLGSPPCRRQWAGLQGWLLGLAGASRLHNTLVTDCISKINSLQRFPAFVRIVWTKLEFAISN